MRKHFPHSRDGSFPWNSVEIELAEAMSHTLLGPLQNEKFDRFLLAPLGEEENGMTLSLRSALAWIDVDPWEETAALVALPRDRARRKLAAMIGVTAKGLRNAPNADAGAARLIDLLPSAAAKTIAAQVIPLPKSGLSSVAMLVGVVVLIIVAYATTHTGAWPSLTSPFSQSDSSKNSGSPP